MGRVELRGTVWSARNTGDAAIHAGQRCSVERVDGLTLDIRG
jgi:membrane protein implicated in regulation of membrane protease activity